MLTDNDINFEFNGILGMALVWVIEDDCLYDLPLSKEHAEMFLSVTRSEDVSAEYPDHNGITVRLFKNNENRLYFCAIININIYQLGFYRLW